MDRLIQDALEDNTCTHLKSRFNCPVGLQICYFQWSVSNHLAVLLAVQNGISSFWEGWTWWRRVSETAQHICYVPEKEGKTINPINQLFLTKDSIKDGDGRTWWTPGRSGKQPWLPYADKAAWTMCQAGRRWHWLRAPCRSGSGWMRMTSYCIDEKTERNVEIKFHSEFNAKV